MRVSEFSQKDFYVYSRHYDSEYKEQINKDLFEIFLIILGYHSSQLLFPYRGRAKPFSIVDERKVNKLFGKPKSILARGNNSFTRCYWKNVDELVTITENNGQRYFNVCLKNGNDLLKLKDNFPKVYWSFHPDNTDQRDLFSCPLETKRLPENLKPNVEYFDDTGKKRVEDFDLPF